MQSITDNTNRYNVTYVSFNVPKKDIKTPEITERPPRFRNIDERMKNSNIKEHFNKAFDTYEKRIQQPKTASSASGSCI